MEKFPDYDLGADKHTCYFHGSVVFSIIYYWSPGICGIPGDWCLYYGYQRRNKGDERCLSIFRSKQRALIWAKEVASDPETLGTGYGLKARLFLEKVRAEIKNRH